MHKYIVYAAFGWLSFSGTMHFIVDVASQYLRSKRTPSPETTLYYGLNTSYAIGQVAFGLLCLWLTRRHPSILNEPAVFAISIVAAIGWLGIAFGFMEYREPRIAAAIFGILVVAATVTTLRNSARTI